MPFVAESLAATLLAPASITSQRRMSVRESSLTSFPQSVPYLAAAPIDTRSGRRYHQGMGGEQEHNSQEPARPAQSGESPQPSEHRSQSFEKFLRGRKVISADGHAVGEIADLMVNSEGWQVVSVHLKLNNSIADHLGIRRGKFHAGTIDVPVGMIQSVGDAVVLAVPTSRLRPTLTGSQDAAA